MQYLNEHPTWAAFSLTALIISENHLHLLTQELGHSLVLMSMISKRLLLLLQSPLTDAPMVHVMPHWNQEV